MKKPPKIKFKFTNQILLLCLILLISACDKNKNVFNNAVQNNTKASSPTQVTISDFNKQVNLSWIPVKGAKSYKIFISETPNTDTSNRQAEIEINAEEVSISEETFPGFKQNTKYFVTIVTISENDEKFASSEFEVISKAVEVVEELTPPENFSVSAEEGQISLDWTNNESAINYVIYWSSTDANVNPVNANHITDIAAPPFKHKNLSSESTYHYRVGAITSQGASPLTIPVSISPEKISHIPATPRGLTAVASDGIVALRWDPVTNADSYTLYMAEESGVNKTNVSQLKGGQTYSEIKGISTNRIQLTNGTNYYFSVSAENHIGSSESTAQVAATPRSFRPQVPNNTSASAGARSISLQWDEVPDSTSYSVYWSTQPGVDATSTNAFHELTKPALVHENIDQTITHYYVITAHNSKTESETSAEVAATPFIPPLAPPVPTNILSEVSARAVTLNWDEVPDVDEYILYIASVDGLTKANYALLPDGTRHRNLRQTSFERKELTPNTIYFYAISTVKNNVESDISPLQSFLTLDVSDKPNEGGEISGPINIVAPESLNKAIVSSHQLQAFSGEDNVTSQVTWSVSDTNIASISNDSESKGILTLLSNGNVTVTAQVNDLENTQDVLIIDLLPPIDITATAGEENIELTWQGQGQGIFNIYRSTELPVSLASESLAATSGTIFTDDNATAGTTYYYALTTAEVHNDKVYQSEISEPVSATIVIVEEPVDTTVPTIDEIKPGQNAEAVPINSSISITFSEEMDSNTLLPQNMTLLSQGSLVEFDVAFTGTQLTISPIGPLNYGANYVFSVNNSVTDLAGNALAQPLVVSINTEIAPTLSITAPAAINKANQANLPLSVLVNGIDKTSEAIWRSSDNSIATISNDPRTKGLLTPISKGDVQITVSFADVDENVNIYVYDLNIPTNLQAERVNGTVELSWEGNGTFEVYRSESLPVSINSQSLTSTTANTFIDDAPLLAASYYAVLATDIKGEEMYRSDLSEPAMVELADIIPPEIKSTTPINNAELIPVESSISITFTEEMNADTINQQNLTLSHQENSVEFDISFTGDKLIISPKNKLLYETNYVVTVNNKVTDLVGNPLAAPLSLDFSTELTPELLINAPKAINKVEFSSFPLKLSSDGIDVSSIAQWRSSNDAIAIVGNEVNNKGQLTLLSKGNVTIIAVYEEIETSVDIHIYDLATPTNAQAKRIKGTVELSWEGNGLFEIYRSETLPVTRESTLIATLEETSFIDQTPLATSSYYAILSSERNGEIIYRGKLSEPAKIDTKPIVLPPPENILGNPKNNQILLTWDAVPDATNYEVRWATIPGDVEKSGDILNHESLLSATHFDLANGDIIYYTVATINSEGIIGSSSEEIEIEVGQLLSDLTFSDPLLARCVVGSSSQYVHKLFSLNCNNSSSITDLDGIEQLTELNSFSASLSASASLNPLANLAGTLTTLNFRNGALHPDLSVFSELNNLIWLLTSNILIDVKQLIAISKNTSLQYLFLNDSGTTDITPIMEMASLLSISINDSFDSTTPKLSTLPVASAWSKLVNLSSFSISYNNVSDISGITASGLPKLENLRIGRQGYPETSLVNLPSSEEWNLPALINVEFIGNGITDVDPISKLSNLSRVNFNTNAINRGVYALKNLTAAIDIDLGKNPNMYCSEVETLDVLSAADISWDECQANMPIDALTIPGSQIITDSTLMECIYFNDVANVEDVDYIDCYGGEGGNISSLEGIEIFRKLNSLYLDFPSIENVSSLKYNPNLTELSILYTDNLDLFTLAEVVQLEVLTLQNMFLNDIEFLSELTNLVELNLRHNNISDFSPLENLPNLNTLSIGYNNINNKTLTSLAGLSNLLNLDLDNNVFTDISTLSKLTSLVSLDLSVNDVSNITPLTGLTDINYLYLNSNLIKNLPPLESFTGWEKLIELDLSSNELFTRTTVNTNLLDALQRLTNLKTLDISHNHLEWFGGLDRLTSLESLYLNDNNLRDISAIGSGSENNPNLITIDLSNNLIHDPSPLEAFTRLSSLNLMNNILYNNIATLATLQSTNISVNGNLHMWCGEAMEVRASFDANTNGTGSFIWDLETCYDPGGSGLSPQLSDILSDPLIVDSTLRSCIRNLMSEEPFGASQIHEVQEFYCNTEGDVRDLSGLRRLAAINTIDLPFHSTSDISELQYLDGLVDIDITSNDVRSGASTLSALSHINTINLSDNNRISCRDINSLDTIDDNDGNATGKVIWTYCDNPIVDQDNFVTPISSSYCPLGGSYFQSFTPSFGFTTINGVDLMISTVADVPEAGFNSIVNIRENIENVPGRILASGKWTIFDNITSTGKSISHAFYPALNITPRTSYFIEWISPDEQTLALAASNPESYTLGTQYVNCSHVNQLIDTNKDMIFRTLGIFDLGPTF